VLFKAHIHTTHTHAHTHIHIHTHTHTYTHARTRAHVHTHTHMRARTHAHTHTHQVMKKLEGRYMFAAVANEPSKTEVTYELDLEFGFPLPGMVRTQICGAIMRTALNAFKTYAETGQGP